LFGLGLVCLFVFFPPTRDALEEQQYKDWLSAIEDFVQFLEDNKTVAAVNFSDEQFAMLQYMKRVNSEQVRARKWDYNPV